MIRILLVIAACVCFAVAVLAATGTIGTNGAAWVAGGLLAWALAALVALLEPYRGALTPPAPPAG